MGKSAAGFVVEELGQGLVVATPVRPTQHVDDERAGRAPKQDDEEAAHLGHADVDQATAAPTGSSPRLFLNPANA